MSHDFSGQNLQGRNFKGQDLADANFSHADIRGANFQGANLTGANFSDARAGLTRRGLIFNVMFALLTAFLLGGTVVATSNWLKDLSLTHNPGLGQKFFSFGIALIIIFASSVLNKFNQTRPTFGWHCKIFLLALLAAGVAVTIVAIGAGTENALSLGLLLLGFQALVTIILYLSIYYAAIISSYGAGLGWGSAVSLTFIGTFTTVLVLGWIDGREDSAILESIAMAATVAALGIYSSHAVNYERTVPFWVVNPSIGTSFYKADLTDVDFSRAELKGTTFILANLTRTCFQNAKNLSSVNAISDPKSYLHFQKIRKLLVTGIGTGENFARANLKGANLAGANLADASFIEADLSEANLENADLSRAKLTNARLDAANLSGANLTGAYLENCFLNYETKVDRVRCDYFFQRIPTPDNPDPQREPADWTATLAEGEWINRIPTLKVENDFALSPSETERKPSSSKFVERLRREGLTLGKSFLLLLMLFLGIFAPFSNRITALAHLFEGERQSDTEKAIAAYRRSIQIDPNLTDAYIDLGQKLQSQEKCDEALTTYRQGIKVNPKDAALHYNLGLQLVCQNQPEEASVAFQRAIQLNPNHAEAYGGLGYALNQRERPGEAIAAYQRAMEIEPQHPYYWNGIGDAYTQQGKSEEASVAYRKALEVTPNCSYSYTHLAKALSAQKKADELVAVYHQALNSNLDDAYTYNEIANALYGQNKMDDAIAAYQKASELNPKEAIYFDNLGDALSKQGKLDEAILQFRKAIEVNPNYLRAYLNLGNALNQQGKSVEASKVYRQWIQRDPKNALARYNLGDTLKQQGKFEEAISQYQQALAIDPKLENAQTHLKEAQRLLALRNNT